MNDAKLATIRGLLAKAESTGFPAERDAFMAKATELIARYGIDEALLAAESTERSTVSQRTLLIEGPYAMDKRHLLHSVYTPLNCKNVDTGKNTKSAVIVHVFGYDSDLDRAELLYTSLLIQALHGMQHDAPQGHTARNTTANRRAWLHGFRGVVGRRIAEAEKRARGEAEETSTGTSTALVLRDRSVAVQDFYNEYIAGWGHGKVVKRPVNVSGRGAIQGRAAGERADIGGKRVGGTRTALR